EGWLVQIIELRLNSNSSSDIHYQTCDPIVWIARWVVRRESASDPLYSFNQAVDLILRRVNSTPRAHETLPGKAEPLDNCHRIEIAVRYEHSEPGELFSNFARMHSSNGERNGRSAKQLRLGSVSTNPVD